MNYRSKYCRGFTLAESLVAVGIVAVVMTAVFYFASRVIRIPREQSAQGALVTEAQVEMERMSDIIRNARGQWIRTADPCSLTVESNADVDEEAEVVRFYKSGNELRRSVDGAEQVLTKKVQSPCGGEEALFTFYSLGGGQAVRLQDSPPKLTEIDRVVVRLVLDEDLLEPPAAAVIVTEITPRKGL